MHKKLSFLEYWVFFGAVFSREQVSCVRTMIFSSFLAFLIFDPNWPFCKGYSFCIVANLGDFQNIPIFQILGVFFIAVSCTTQLSSGRRIVFSTFLAFFIFDPNRPFCKGSSLCVVVNSGHFQNALIFGILVIFTNFVPLKSSYLLTLNQYLSNIF